MKVCRTGTSACSRAKRRASSSEGTSLSSAASATTLIEHRESVGEAQPAGRQQDREVVEHVGCLLGHALIRLVERGTGNLLGLLAHLLLTQVGVREQSGGVAVGGIRVEALGDGALERADRLAGRRLHLAVVEAGALARVARGTGRLDLGEQRIGVAVPAERSQPLDV